MQEQQLLQLDKAHVWHPYSVVNPDTTIYPVASANGVYIRLTDGRELVDGMSSWWCAIHGYNHPQINQAIESQLHKMSHVMFGGLTHQPAVELTTHLIDLTPDPLQSVFFSDSGSVAVEIAMKMAVQYWYAKNKAKKQHFLTISHGYHGDTFGAMSVCDPINGMHGLFQHILAKQYFSKTPNCGFDEPCTDADIAHFAQQLASKKEYIAAVIMEPIVQGAGGMKFYSPEYLSQVRELCDTHNVLLILDEIATGFGRTGKLFACQHANVTPDIMCLGKALTGGYMSLAATLTTTEIAYTIRHGEPGVFMHGPTFMANPLACATALSSLKILATYPWQTKVQEIEKQLKLELAPCQKMAIVRDVRVLGAIGVVELIDNIDMITVQPMFVEAGVWIRPFGKLLYLMPPFIIEKSELKKLTAAVTTIVEKLCASL